MNTEAIGHFQELFTALVEQGYTPTLALSATNALTKYALGVEYSICEYCQGYGAQDYEYEGNEWVICPACESHEALKAEAQADALMGK